MTEKVRFLGGIGFSEQLKNQHEDEDVDPHRYGHRIPCPGLAFLW